MEKWTHPGGKLIELGSDSLTDAELLSIFISTGTKGKSAEDIAKDILDKFGSFKGMANQPLEKFLKTERTASSRKWRLKMNYSAGSYHQAKTI